MLNLCRSWRRGCTMWKVTRKLLQLGRVWLTVEPFVLAVRTGPTCDIWWLRAFRIDQISCQRVFTPDWSATSSSFSIWTFRQCTSVCAISSLSVGKKIKILCFCVEILLLNLGTLHLRLLSRVQCFMLLNISTNHLLQLLNGRRS